MTSKSNQVIKDRIQQSSDLLNKGKKIEAVTIFRGIVEPLPEDVATRTELANLGAKLGEKIDVINIRAQLVADYPDNAAYVDDLGQAYMENDMLVDAANCFNKAISMNPDLYHPYFGHGYIEISNGNYSRAIEYLRKALELKPGEISIYINLTTALISDNRSEEAREYANILIRKDPKNPLCYLTMGRIMSEMGQFDEAVKQYEKAISLDKTYGFAYSELSGAKKFSAEDDKFIKQTEGILKSSMSPESRAAINFSLGKMHNDCKNYDRAFEYYKQANIISKPAVPRLTIEEAYKKTHKIFTKNFLEKYRYLGSDSQKPVFVIGMPRSGTTLIERVIAKHPEGGGAGELCTMADISNSISSIKELGSYNKKLEQSIVDNRFKDYIDHYLQELSRGQGDASRIVDKMPSNIFLLGLIQLMFPNSYIINAMRSPLDTCLSCYFQTFAALDWSYDIDSIVDEYRCYRHAIEYWKKILPPGRMIDVRYEDMIADPEGQSRRIIESLDLEWDPACLDFHNAKSVVNTASFWQVRQPIYKSSSKRWIKYAKHIEPLAQGLKEYLDEDDIHILAEHGVKIKRGLLASIMSR